MKDLILKMADDALIIGHRNSEWTGIGPVLEEDIAFSSMSQDKIGHAWALYRMLNAGGMSQSGDKLSVRFVVGGREVSYQVRVGTLENPFALQALRNFSCPSGL